MTVIHGSAGRKQSLLHILLSALAMLALQAELAILALHAVLTMLVFKALRKLNFVILIVTKTSLLLRQYI